jgi:hypothetical protein
MLGGMNRTRTTLVAVGLAGVLALPTATLMTPSAGAAAKAKTTVTIKAEGTDLSGKVRARGPAARTAVR